MLQLLSSESFTALDYIDLFKSLYPSTWESLKEQYGEGGKGQGKHNTVYGYISQRLGMMVRRGHLVQIGYQPAPDSFGNSEIMYWALASAINQEINNHIHAEAPAIDEEFREGSVALRVHLRRERNWRLPSAKRLAFIKEHGRLFCERCKLDPEISYGLPIGNSVIDVHHIKLVSQMEPNAKVALSDLQCLCANCHRIVHAEMREIAAGSNDDDW